MIGKKSMKRIALINCYFGCYPHYFDKFLESCKNNGTIDFYFFTDNHIDSISDNIHFIYITFDDLKKKIQSCFNFAIELNLPYKLCDFKPSYGYIFSDYVEGYDYWGYCDVDMIFGDIRSFLSDDILNSFDKIYQLGHLTLFRNTNDINTLFMKDDEISFKKSFSTDMITVFDEIEGINRIFEKKELPIYKRCDYADISKKHYRFRLSNVGCDNKNNNYNRQLFVKKGNHIYRYFFIGREIFQDEFIYIHFQKRKMAHSCKESDFFVISPEGFFKLNEEETVDERMIKKYDKRNLVKEIRQKLSVLFWKIKRKTKKVFKK